MSQFCKENGIIHELTTLYTPESNRVVKEKSITLLECYVAKFLSARELVEGGIALSLFYSE